MPDNRTRGRRSPKSRRTLPASCRSTEDRSTTPRNRCGAGRRRGVATGVQPKIIPCDFPGVAEFLQQPLSVEAASHQAAQRLLDRVVLRLEPCRWAVSARISGRSEPASITPSSELGLGTLRDARYALGGVGPCQVHDIAHPPDLVVSFVEVTFLLFAHRNRSWQMCLEGLELDASEAWRSTIHTVC